LGSRPVSYFDLVSPYAYLAVARAARVLGQAFELEPIPLGAIFKLRGSGSWAHTSTQAMRVAQIEARAAHYGLPRIVWPPTWPSNALSGMRAATWAKAKGRLAEFTSAVYAAEFGRGQDPADLGVLARCAEEACLDGNELTEATEHPAIKDQLRAATTTAWTAGVSRVPTLIASGVVYYGDDQLELAAQAGP
jgi:2-hydroxychromene-2-carboxylate isomerase